MSENASDSVEPQDVFVRIEPGKRKAHRRNILRAALACFNESGLEATTVEMIRDRADSSVGSIYHHFDNKEGIVTALCVVALQDQIERVQAAMLSADTVQETLAAMIRTYLTWVTEEVELARFMFKYRSTVMRGPSRDVLRKLSRQRYLAITRRMEAAVLMQKIRFMPREIYASFIIGPTEHYCRQWLSGGAKTPPIKLADHFINAAWAALAK